MTPFSNCVDALAEARAELAAARATIARCEALLGKWGPASVRGVYNDYARDAYMFCWNDLSKALSNEND